MAKGTYAKNKKFYGIITIAEKGQIAIPVELRKELKLEKGKKLMVIKRDDCKEINLIKSNEIEGFSKKLSKN